MVVINTAYMYRHVQCWKNEFLNSDIICDNYSFCGFLQYFKPIPNKGYNLDLCFCNFNTLNIAENLDSLLPVDKHHLSYIISINLVANKSLAFKSQKRNFFNANYDQINIDLCKVGWEYELIGGNVNSMIQTFYKIINRTIDQNVSFYCFYPSKFPSWFSKDLIHAVINKHFYHFYWMCTGDPDAHIEFKKYRALSKRLSRSCYLNYINLVQADCYSNPRSFFSFVKNKSNSTGFPDRVSYNELVSFDRQSSTELFAKFFGSVYTNYDYLYKCPNFVLPNVNDLFNIDYDDILSVVSSLKISDSSGPDGIPPNFVINCIYSLLLPLKLIFQESLLSCTFPDLWKISFITPIFKSGEEGNVANYRPISILCTFSKILEGIFQCKLYNRVSKLICPNQHGFVKGLSIVTNLTVHSVCG